MNKTTMKKVFTATPKKRAKADTGAAVCDCQCTCACALGYGEANMFNTDWGTQSGKTHGKK